MGNMTLRKVNKVNVSYIIFSENRANKIPYKKYKFAKNKKNEYFMKI